MVLDNPGYADPLATGKKLDSSAVFNVYFS